ncbi:unnamed protein product [Durusdinium trenchii]|uniref:Exoribonuclease phosphorolytic domain-containing protein n=2 Tax=Durusdinium trenchii TaxID=1381693 RepID=A0ABP0PNI7_9DINO
MALLGEPPVQPERQDFSAPLRYAPKAPPQRSVRTRRKEETRPCQLRINAVPNAAGSAYLEQGRTKILATVYGPRQAERDRQQARAEGQLFVEVHFAPFCARDFNKEESEKRAVLYNSILQSTLESVILLERYGKTAFDVTLLVLEDDGAVLTGSLAAASLALADAKVEMRDLIAGATVHLKPRDASAAGGEELLLDCDRAEELAMPEKSAVLHLGLCPARGLVCLLHSVGPLPPKPFEQMVLLAKDTAEAFGAEMRRCLQDQVHRRAEKKRARSFGEILEVDSSFLDEDMAVLDDGYG